MSGGVRSTRKPMTGRTLVMSACLGTMVAILLGCRLPQIGAGARSGPSSKIVGPDHDSILLFLCGCDACKRVMAQFPRQLQIKTTVLTSQLNLFQSRGSSPYRRVTTWRLDDYDQIADSYHVSGCPTAVVHSSNGTSKVISGEHVEVKAFWRNVEAASLSLDARESRYR